MQKHRFEVIQFEGIEMIPYLATVLAYCDRAQNAPRLVFDDHNAEYVLQQRVFEMDVRIPYRWPGALYSFIQWQKLKRYEAWACRRVHAAVAVSEPDALALQRLVPGRPIAVVPNGIDVAEYQAFETSEPTLPPHSLVFTGKMDFRPNIDAALWFAQRVLPLVQRRVADARFYIVGQRPHARLNVLRDQPGVVVTGRVPDTRPFIAGAAVYVIPLRSGGGTRFKVLEAMALRRPIVSTSMGCAGFPVTSGREVMLADDAETFAARVLELSQDTARCEGMGAAGLDFAMRYDWSRIVPRLEAVYAV
jgi:glycosyltransferase involved in cell wall biosynthesis